MSLSLFSVEVGPWELTPPIQTEYIFISLALLFIHLILKLILSLDPCGIGRYPSPSSRSGMGLGGGRIGRHNARK